MNERKKLIIGIILIVLSAAAVIAGIKVSQANQSAALFVLFSIPAAIMIVSGGALAGPPLLSGQAPLLLTGGDEVITAEILGVTRNLRTEGGKVQYYVICRRKNPVTGKEETYTSDPLDEYPGKEIIGKTVTVRIDPAEKGKYKVELDQILSGQGPEE